MRRARFYIGLTYDTSIDQMKKVVNEIETLINDHPRTDQEGRVKFQEFGASSLDIMVLFYEILPNGTILLMSKKILILKS